MKFERGTSGPKIVDMSEADLALLARQSVRKMEALEARRRENGDPTAHPFIHQPRADHEAAIAAAALRAKEEKKGGR